MKLKLIIDIPDKVYGVLKYFEESMGLSGKKEDENDDVKTALIRAVVNGTPLPKGHGRLVDADEYAKKYKTNINGRIGEEYVFAPTVIEADKEGREVI